MLLLAAAAVLPALSDDSVAIPDPAGLEDANDMDFFRLFAGPGLKVCRGYVTAEDNKKFGTVNRPRLLSYAMVQTMAVDNAVSAEQFKEIVEGTKQAIGAEKIGDVASQIIKERTGVEASIGRPVVVGRTFASPEAAGWLMLLTVSAGSEQRIYLCNMFLMRIKGRAYFFYRYDQYTGDGDFNKASKLGETWAEAIAAANNNK